VSPWHVWPGGPVLLGPRHRPLATISIISPRPPNPGVEFSRIESRRLGPAARATLPPTAILKKTRHMHHICCSMGACP
jgi:hypothetical protein